MNSLRVGSFDKRSFHDFLDSLVELCEIEDCRYRDIRIPTAWDGSPARHDEFYAAPGSRIVSVFIDGTTPIAVDFIVDTDRYLDVKVLPQPFSLGTWYDDYIEFDSNNIDKFLNRYKAMTSTMGRFSSEEMLPSAHMLGLEAINTFLHYQITIDKNLGIAAGVWYDGYNEEFTWLCVQELVDQDSQTPNTSNSPVFAIGKSSDDMDVIGIYCGNKYATRISKPFTASKNTVYNDLVIDISNTSCAYRTSNFNYSIRLHNPRHFNTIDFYYPNSVMNLLMYTQARWTNKGQLIQLEGQFNELTGTQYRGLNSTGESPCDNMRIFIKEN